MFLSLNFLYNTTASAIKYSDISEQTDLEINLM